MSVLFKVSTESCKNIRKGGILLVEHFMLSGNGVDSSTISVPLSLDKCLRLHWKYVKYIDNSFWNVYQKRKQSLVTIRNKLCI